MVAPNIIELVKKVRVDYGRSAQKTNDLAKSEDNLNKSQKSATKGRQDFLTHFTKVRWAIVNVALIGAVVTSLGVMTKKILDTSYEIARLSAVSDKSFGEVSDAVVDMAGKTIASNEETIKTFQELAKAGFTLAETQTIIEQSAKGSILGFSSLQDTAMATSQAMRQFGGTTEDVSDIMWSLVAAANAGKVDIENIGEAFKFAGAIANQTGTSMDELSATIAILSNRGLQTTQIGRGIRQSLLSLVSPSSQAADAMEAYGIDIQNTDGSMKSLLKIIEELDNELSGLAESEKKNILGKIFPSNAITIILELMGDTREEIEKLIDSFEEAKILSRLQEINVEQQSSVKFTKLWNKFWATANIEIGKSLTTTNEVVDALEGQEKIEKAISLARKKGYDDFVSTFEKIRLIRKESSSSFDDFVYMGFEPNDIVMVEEFLKYMSELPSPIEQSASALYRFNNELKDIEDSQFVSQMLSLAGIFTSLGLPLDTLTNKLNKKKKVEMDTLPILKDINGNQEEANKKYERAKTALNEYNQGVQKIKDSTEDLTEEQQKINFYTKTFQELLSGRWGDSVVDMFNDLKNAEEETFSNSIKDAIDLYEESISNLKDELEDAKNEQNKFSDAISATEKRIDNIINRRFKISGISETDVSGLIRKQELEIAKAQFNALNLGSAEDFLRNAVVLSSDAISEQTTALNELSSAAEQSQSRFDAWETSLRTTIRELLMNSQDLDRDVTEVVRKAQTQLLSITNTNNGGGASTNDQFSVLNDNLDALRLAEQVFFGEERTNLELSEQAREDRINGFNESSEQAIANLESERTTLADLTAQEAEWGTQIDSITQKIKDETAAIERENKILKENNALKGGTSSGGGVSGELGSIESRTIIHGGFSSGETHVGGKYQDFISRPGVPVQSFSPQDTIIGVKQPENVLGGGSTTNHININIQGGRFNERQLAIEIKRELSSLALT